MQEPNAVAGPSTSGPSRRSLSPTGPTNQQPPTKRQRTQAAMDDTTTPPSTMRKAKGRKKRATSSDPAPLAPTQTSRFSVEMHDGTPDGRTTPAALPKFKDHPSPSKESHTDGTIRCICETHWDDGQMVQCDECQTWQHTKCYRVDFERLTKDSAAVWICLVCGPGKWNETTLDPEWAKRMQKKEEERERLAALTKQLDMQAAKNGRKGRAGRKPPNAAAGGAFGPTNALAGSGGAPGTAEREEEVDDAESWRQVYVSVKQNVIEKDVRPQIRQFMTTYGPGSKFFTKALEANRGWTTPSSKGKGKEREVTGYDILSRSLPIIVTADELLSAENEEWVTVRARHVPPAEESPPVSAPVIRPPSPSASRIRGDTTGAPPPFPPPGPPALTVVTTQSDYSYGNVFLRTVALNATSTDSQYPSKSPPIQRNAAKAAARTASPPPPERARPPAISPTNARSRRITPVQPDEDEIPERPAFSGPDGVPKSDPFSAQKYTLHASQCVPPRTLLAPFPANVCSHTAYLATPSNQYFHLGAPKPHVRVLGAPLEVALDARVVGGLGRFVRCGCWPNAALRSVVVKPDKRKRAKKTQRVDVDVVMDDEETDDGSIQFGIFSLRELAEGEEIVIAWEWDDAHRIHRLPKLLLEEARMLLDQDRASFSEQETRYYETLCQTLMEAFTSCACADDPQVNTGNKSVPNHRPNILSATEPTKTCALEEFSRWVTRRKGELDPRALASTSTPAREDDDRTEPDDEIGRRVWEPQRPASSQANPTLLIHPSKQGGVTTHPSVPQYAPSGRQSSTPVMSNVGLMHPSLARIVPAQFTKPQNTYPAVGYYPDRGTPQPSLHPSLQAPLVAPKPIPASQAVRLEPPRPPSSGPIFRSASGIGSLASLMNPNDTYPLSGQPSRPASSSSHLTVQQRNEPSPASRAITTSPINKLRQLWGRNVTAASLIVRDNDDDEDVLIRALGISLGSVIGSKRGVRMEDANGGGMLGVRVVQGYGRVKSKDVRTNGKRTHCEFVEEDFADDSAVEHAAKRRKVDTVLPPLARRRLVPSAKPRRPRVLSGQMDVDRAESPFEYPFTFSVPPLEAPSRRSASNALSTGQGQEDVMMSETTSAPKPGVHHRTVATDSLSVSPPPSQSKRSTMMSIAKMLNSPTAPTFSRESFQRKMSRQEARSESRSPPPPPFFAHSPAHSGGSALHSPFHDPRFLPEGPPSLEASSRDPSLDSVDTNDTTIPDEREGTPGAATSPPHPPNHSINKSSSQLSEAATFQPVTSPTAPDDMDARPTTAVSGTSEQLAERARPITPIPMAIAPSLMPRRWQSPGSSSTHGEPSSREEPNIQDESKDTRDTSETIEKRGMEEPSEGCLASTIPRRFSPAPMAPVVIRGRLVTPPSRENTPTPAPSSPGAKRRRSSSTSESSSEEESESSEEEEEDPDVKMASSSDDSLTPAPSPPPPPVVQLSVVVPAVPVIATAETSRIAEKAAFSQLDEEDKQEHIPNHVDSIQASTDLATSPAPPLTESSRRSPNRTDSPEHPVNEVPAPDPTSSEPPQARAESEETTVPAAPVRRIALKDYARRKKKDVTISPSNVISPVINPMLSAGWTSPLASRSAPLPETPIAEVPPTSSEPEWRTTWSQSSSSGQVADGSVQTPLTSTKLEAATEPDTCNMPETPIKVIHTSPPLDTLALLPSRESSGPDNKPNGHKEYSARTPSPQPASGGFHVAAASLNPPSTNVAMPSDSPPFRFVPPSSSTPLSLAQRIEGPFHTFPTRPRTPLSKGAGKAMEDGEIDASQPSSPARALARPKAISPAASYQGGRNASPRRDDWDRDSNPPAHPRSFNNRSLSAHGRDRSPVASSSTSTSAFVSNQLLGASSSSTPKPLTNGAPTPSAPRPPIGPRSNAPPPSGPRALRGLEPRSQGSGWDKRPWERHSDRDRDSDRERDRDRDRDRDRRDDRYWRDSRPRGGYRPRGK